MCIVMINKFCFFFQTFLIFQFFLSIFLCFILLMAAGLWAIAWKPRVSRNILAYMTYLSQKQSTDKCLKLNNIVI